MSFDLFPLNDQQIDDKMPSISQFQNSLVLIQTVKDICHPQLSYFSNQHEKQFQPQDSLGEQLIRDQKQNEKSVNISRKKKTGCICKKTKCLKMYCQCFSNGKVCGKDCQCISCGNNEQNIEQINAAIAHIKSKSPQQNLQGCKCRKSKCQKKYCECFNSGKKCNSACKCIDCQNDCSQIKDDINPERQKIVINSFQSLKDKSIRKYEIFQTPNKKNTQLNKINHELTSYKQKKQENKKI